VQSAVHIAIMNPRVVYSERGQFPLRAEARRLDDDRLAVVPDSGAAVYLRRSGPLAPRAGPFSYLRAGSFSYLRAGSFSYLRAGPFSHLRARGLLAPARRACPARPCSPGHQEHRRAPG
jgi:hypothetical protein